MSELLERRGVRSAYYHSMVDPELKPQLQAQWRSGEVQVKPPRRKAEGRKAEGRKAARARAHNPDACGL